MRLLVLPLILAIAGCGGQREGTVKYSDCREIIPLSKNDFEMRKIRGTTFTCDYVRDANNRIVGGECVAVETGLLGSGCTTAYVYTIQELPLPGGQPAVGDEAEREKLRKLMSTPCPSAHEVHREDGICVCEPGYTVDPSATNCVPITQ